MKFLQALAKDLPWKLKESRVLEILQAVSIQDPLLAPSRFVGHLSSFIPLLKFERLKVSLVFPDIVFSSFIKI